MQTVGLDQIRFGNGRDDRVTVRFLCRRAGGERPRRQPRGSRRFETPSRRPRPRPNATRRRPRPRRVRPQKRPLPLRHRLRLGERDVHVGRRERRSPARARARAADARKTRVRVRVRDRDGFLPEKKTRGIAVLVLRGAVVVAVVVGVHVVFVLHHHLHRREVSYRRRVSFDVVVLLAMALVKRVRKRPFFFGGARGARRARRVARGERLRLVVGAARLQHGVVRGAHVFQRPLRRAVRVLLFGKEPAEHPEERERDGDAAGDESRRDGRHASVRDDRHRRVDVGGVLRVVLCRQSARRGRREPHPRRGRFEPRSCD
jgi:hypothetical protein